VRPGADHSNRTDRMSRETPQDDPRQQSDWGSHKQTDKPWKEHPEKDQHTDTSRNDLEKWQKSRTH
jgi:hypothetical protein